MIIELISLFRIRICKNKEFNSSVEQPPFQTVTAKDYRLIMPPPPQMEMNKQVQEESGISNKGISEEITSASATIFQQTTDSPNAIRELDDDGTEHQEKTIDSVQPIEEDSKHNKRWLSIDSEIYECQSTLRVSMLPRTVQIYHKR